MILDQDRYGLNIKILFLNINQAASVQSTRLDLETLVFNFLSEHHDLYLSTCMLNIRLFENLFCIIQSSKFNS